MNDKKGKSAAAWILGFAGNRKSWYLLSVLLSAAGACCQMIPFFLTARMVVQLLNGTGTLSLYIRECGWIALVWALRCFLYSVSTLLSHKATFHVLGQIRKQSLTKLERMPLGEVKKRGSGELKNILVERIDSLETTLAHIIPEVSGNLCVLVLTAIYLFVLNWKMALASLLTLPLGLIFFCLMQIGYEKNYRRTVEATKELNDTAVEYIRGIEVIKVFGKAKSSYERFARAAREGADSYIDWMRKCNLPFTFGMSVMPATLLSVLPIGGFMVLSGSLSVPDFIQVVILASGLITPIITILSYEDDMAKTRLVLGEVTGILEAEELPRPETSRHNPEDGGIQLENVHFGYGDSEVLHGISLNFEPGTVNALVGPSGSGKSTIAWLIASFWDPDQGAVRIGGVDIRDLSAESYYRNVAYVSQENFLFDTSILENIRMGNPEADDEQVMEATRACGCHDFILGLEKGYQTMAGSGGSHLSGGEKQRICIARAMLKDAPVVILDEATAYTDPENETQIQKALSALIQNKTVLVIAHRLSTIQDADQIAVINEGSVAACGRHEELLENSPLYRSLWEAHMRSRDSMEGGKANA